MFLEVLLLVGNCSQLCEEAKDFPKEDWRLLRGLKNGNNFYFKGIKIQFSSPLNPGLILGIKEIIVHSLFNIYF